MRSTGAGRPLSGWSGDGPDRGRARGHPHQGAAGDHPPRFKPQEYRDEDRLALEELIARKLKGEQRSAKRPKPEPKVTDLMEALKQSVEASRSSRRAVTKPRRARTRKARAA